MDFKEQMKEIMDASVTCDKCNYEFVLKEESIMKEKMEVKGLKFDLIYFYCPSCKKIYRASIQDRKYYLLVEELDKVRKQVRDNFGTFDECIFYFRIHDQVYISLTITGICVSQSVEFLRKDL